MTSTWVHKHMNVSTQVSLLASSKMVGKAILESLPCAHSLYTSACPTLKFKSPTTIFLRKTKAPISCQSPSLEACWNMPYYRKKNKKTKRRQYPIWILIYSNKYICAPFKLLLMLLIPFSFFLLWTLICIVPLLFTFETSNMTSFIRTKVRRRWLLLAFLNLPDESEKWEQEQGNLTFWLKLIPFWFPLWERFSKALQM